MYGQFMPLVYIKKTAELNSDQVDDLLPNVFKQMKNEWVLFWVFLIAAILFAFVGVVLCIKSRGLAAQAAQEAQAAAQNKGEDKPEEAPQDKQVNDSVDGGQNEQLLQQQDSGIN